MRQLLCILIALLFTVPLFAESKIAAPGKTVEKLAGDFVFTEGPIADKEGNVFFTDNQASIIYKWSTDGKLSTFLKDTQESNGLAFDKDGNLIACAGKAGQVWSINMQGKITVIAAEYNGKPFNSPNDLWIDPQGGIYFTDPRYGPRENLPQDGEHVYYIRPDRKEIFRVADDMVRPNGIIGTGKGILYIADLGGRKTYQYKINADGTLADKKLFVEQGSDGMTLDKDYNLYLTTKAVDVYDPNGVHLETITTPETPANMCFGGKANNILFITARTSLYALETQTEGLKPNNLSEPKARK